ncbi:oxygen-independent coproporphyrinogen III oxidase [Qipengyuania aquimaris]|uniref:Coproporphyrinogen-III oxidase n=1 Tax=Qipengyuania aquimaris TaxID=255984 RepID=A0A9Q3S0P4_9SPHN|nr:oxygen-independent coproporphyrinogen III oxidase [Qipengyuania aquimaris]MBY6218069.1 oxygen-independent coproporphyrinogen III oxidase [Qipengyuania aquimaris]
MWTHYPDLLAKPVPRYTSYPTAAEFGPLEPTRYCEALEGAGGDISLYLHIPFCEKICFYCGCNTGAAGRRHRLESYLTALHAEIETVAELLPEDARVSRVSFGGGSPNAILPQEFLDLVEALHRNFTLSDTVWSTELDPRSMSAEWGEAIGAAGITRASLGVQTFAAHCQQAIGRVQEDSLICRTIDWLRDAGVTSLNFDLMYGLPHQSAQDLSDSLEYASILGADRIALFGYAHVPHIVPRQRMIEEKALSSVEERFTMAASGYDLLVEKGYVPVGFDHFAKPRDPMAIAVAGGTLRRNFQGFTDDGADSLIGLGSSAISSFPQLLAQNEKNSGRYRMLASQDRLTTTRGIVRSADDRMRGEIIEHLLCRGEAELTPCILAGIRTRLDPFVDRGLARLDGLTLTLLPEGRPYARALAATIDAYREDSFRKFSTAI